MQVSAMKPMGLNEESIDPKVLDDEKDIILKQIENTPDNKKEQIKLDDESGFEFTNKIISNVDDTISSKGKKEPIKEEKETLDCFGEIDWDDI